MSVSSCVRAKPLAVLFAVLLAGMAVTAAAQEAGVYGTVSDATGDALPGVTVTVTNAETGLQRTVTSGGDGLYQVPSLPVGTYSVMASLDGFQTVTNEGLRLQVAQQVTLNISLELAGVEEAVTVTASAPLIESRQADFSTVITEEQVEVLPMQGRKWLDLATLSPRHQPGRDPRRLLQQRQHRRRGHLLLERLLRGRGEQQLAAAGRTAAGLPAGRHRRVQGSGVQRQRRLRLCAGRLPERGHQERHEPDQRQRLRVLPHQGAQLEDGAPGRKTPTSPAISSAGRSGVRSSRTRPTSIFPPSTPTSPPSSPSIPAACFPRRRAPSRSRTGTSWGSRASTTPSMTIIVCSRATRTTTTN